jgi:hypothetical protein
VKVATALISMSGPNTALEGAPPTLPILLMRVGYRVPAVVAQHQRVHPKAWRERGKRSLEPEPESCAAAAKRHAYVRSC